MKITLSTYQAADTLLADENANWSRAGAFALVEWLEEIEEDEEREMSLCVVAIRCDFSEYEDATDWAGDYYGQKEKAPTYDHSLEFDEQEAMFMEYLQENTCVIEFEGGIIIQGF